MKTAVLRLAVALAAGVLFLAATGCGDASGGSGAVAASTTTPPAVTPDEPETPPEDAIPVTVSPVRREAISSLYSTSATLRAEKTATVTTRTTGVLERLAVEEGDRVTAGQPLAYLEDDEQKIAFQRARATFETLQRDFQRNRKLHDEGLLSDEAFETTRREYRDAEHAADLAELELARTVIRAPFAGVVVRRHMDAGGTVATNAPLYDIADVSPLQADVNVPERHVRRLAVGQVVRLLADVSETAIEARIERIAPAVDPGTGTIKVTVAVPLVAGIRPGAFVRVNIVTDTHADALVVPRPSLVAEGKRWHVFRVAEDDKVEQVEVALGYEEANRVEIRAVAGGKVLTEGAQVVSAGAPSLTDGTRVRVMDGVEPGGTGGTP